MAEQQRQEPPVEHEAAWPRRAVPAPRALKLLAPDLRLDGVLCSRKHITCGRRTRDVLSTGDSEVHPSRVHALKHFFGRSSVALRDAELLERSAHPARGTAKAFTSSFRTSPNCSATSSALTIEPSSMTRCLDHAGPVRSVATSAPMSSDATIVDFRFVGL